MYYLIIIFFGIIVRFRLMRASKNKKMPDSYCRCVKTVFTLFIYSLMKKSRIFTAILL